MESIQKGKSNSLVTGVAGFIGAHVAKELCSRGHNVVGLDDLSGGFRENIPSGVQFVEGSVNDENLVWGLFQQHKFDYVFHLAAYAAEGLSHFIRSFNYRNNLLGSINLINSSVNSGTVKCFVFTSSIAVYGKAHGQVTEADRPCPMDPYGVAKHAVEQDLAAAQDMFGLPYIVFRPHNVYGEGQNISDPYRNVVGIFMRQILEKEPLSIYGDGSQTRSFTYISDVAPIIATAVENPAAYNQVFNLGCDEPHSILSLAARVAKAMGSEPRLQHLPQRHELLHVTCSHAKARRYFTNLPTSVPLNEGLARMATWVKQSGLRKVSQYNAIEIGRLMPDHWRQEQTR